MSDNKITARQAAQAVLQKAQEILAKSETLKKYAPENSKKPGVKYGSIETKQKALERDYNDFEVKKQGDNSKDNRLATQVSPGQNPAERKEGNNKPDGMEPRYQFKDKVAGELAKENAAHMIKKENPDKDADAKLGEKVEKEVEEHFKENKDAEKKEGHKLMVKSDEKSKFGRCVEGVKENSPKVTSPEAVCVAEGVKPEQQKSEKDTAIIPRLVASAKLSKFMEHMHSKRKAREAQSAPAVGSPAADAPPARSGMDGKPTK